MAHHLTPPRLRLVLELVFRPYAQIIFSRDLPAGLLVLCAVGTFPRLALATLAAVLVADAVAWLAGLGAHAIREGAIGCIAVLTTLAIAVFAQNGASVTLIVAGAVLAVLFQASFQAVFSRIALPTHSLPFVAAAWTAMLAARQWPPPGASLNLLQPLGALPPSLFELPWLDVPAAILFLHGAAAGGLLLAAIATYSRIALLLATIGWGAAFAVRALVRPGVPWAAVDLIAAFNGVLAAIAVGGVWFVPHPTSMLFAAGGAALACVVAYALTPIAALLELPALSLPFVVTTHLILTAMRMRERDDRPASALPADRPEDALARHVIRVRRFGSVAWLPFRLPFRGTWMVTQGYGGPHTHQGPWRHAFDFEVRGPAGRTFEGEGRDLRDHLCYGLPILAAGTGTVAEVIDDVPDNRPGEINARENWGNAVVIAHRGDLYSVCAHLQPKSIHVKPGDIVRAGTEIGRCGNSGRSAVPHLHFHVQRGAALGSPTIPADFGDVVASTNGTSRIAQRVIPAEGDLVRPVLRDDVLAHALAFPPGSEWTLSNAETGEEELARVEIDLWGTRVLRSDAGRLSFESYDSGIVMVAADDVAGDSLLPYVLLALARVPFDHEAALTWSDRVPRRLLLGRWVRTAFDLVAVVAPRLADIEVMYTSHRTEAHVIIEGTSNEFATRAVVSLNDEPHRLDVERKGRRTVVTIEPRAAAHEGR